MITPFLLIPKLLLAGGSSFLGNLELPAMVDVPNHTLAGEKIPASKVVCRNQWGTPMLPDGKAGYSLIAPINEKLIAQSLWIPPVSGSRPKSDSLPVTVPSPASASPSAESPIPSR
jgi:hypothetical protein